MNLRLAILTPNPFPVGNVATNRLSTYAKALANAGFYVKVYVLKATELLGAVNNHHVYGINAGINYEYMYKTTIWNQKANIFHKLWQYLYGIVKAFLKIRKDEITSLILYTNDPFYILLFCLYSKMFSLRIFIDKSEYLSVTRERWSLYKMFYIKTFKLLDGVIVMTNELMAYYSSIISKESRCFLLPMTVDSARFIETYGQIKRDDYVAAVFGTHNRDCILDTIMSFVLFKKSHPNSNIKLYLIGDFQNLRMKELIIDYLDCHQSIASSIYFTGNVVSSLIPELLAGAKILITTPREYVSGGFPTKLGEYLATGNPVVATSVGEIPLYLEHMNNCLLAEPGDIEGIAGNLDLLYSNSSLSRKIGHKGQEVARIVFNADSYVPDLVKFINGDIL